jgi:hypothetical protein
MSICLAISEPWAGSDVANIRTTATKTDCGGYYIGVLFCFVLFRLWCAAFFAVL